jgi:hypothetical protein
MDQEAARRATDIAQDARSDAVEREDQLAAILTRASRALERSAAIAEEHARRGRQRGDAEQAAKEEEAAARAHDAARRAQARAEEASGRKRRVDRGDGESADEVG